MAKQRGRKSIAELSVVSQMPGERPVAPKELTKEEAEEWRAIVARMPANWFPRESWPILVALCRHIVEARFLSGKIGAIADTDDNIRVRRTLLTMRDKENKGICNCSTKLRLTTQSRLQPVSAARQADGVKSKKPWEFGS